MMVAVYGLRTAGMMVLRRENGDIWTCFGTLRKLVSLATL